jgi:hypothetical protein
MPPLPPQVTPMGDNTDIPHNYYKQFYRPCNKQAQ